MADWRDEAQQTVKRKMEKGTFTLPPGENTIRILPNVKGIKYPPYVIYMYHRDVGINKRYLRCGKDPDTGEGDCWLCDKAIPKLEQSDKKVHRLMAKAMVAKEQFLVQVAWIDSDTDKMRGPKFWYVSTGGAKSLSTALLALLARTKKKYDDPKKGYNLNIHRVGTGKTDTKYGAFDPDDEPTQVPDSILSKLKPFSEIVPEYDEDKQKRAYRGEDEPDGEEESEDVEDLDMEDVVSDKDEDEEEDDGGGRSKKKKSTFVDEDEEEEEAPVKGRKVKDEDEEEEELLVSSNKKKKSRSVVDEDEEPEEKPVTAKGKKKGKVEIDEDEEEEKVVASSKKKKPKPDEDEEEEEEEDE